MNNIDILIDDSGRYLKQAAAIWAAATAARDQDPEPATLNEACSVIQKVLTRSAFAFLVIAMIDNEAVGFAALAPISKSTEEAELVYLGIAPLYWHRHIGSTLLNALRPILARKGFLRIFLDVYCDNERAVRLYEQHGWQRSGSPQQHPITKRLEQCFWINTAELSCSCPDDSEQY